MEKIFIVKEKLNEILSFINRFDNIAITELEKEILLQKLKDVYFDLSLLEVNKIEETRDSEVVEKPVEQEAVKPEVVAEKIEEKPFINKEPEKTIVDEKPVVETKKDSFVPIDFFELDDEESAAVTEVVSEKKAEVKKSQIIEQGSLFPSDNNSGSSKQSLGEQLGQNKTSLNEILASQSTTQDLNARIKPVSDIRSAISVGDRFMFVRELFDGNTDLFNETITNLNSMQSYDEAKNYLKSRFQWNLADDNVESFLNTVKRRYV